MISHMERRANAAAKEEVADCAHWSHWNHRTRLVEDTNRLGADTNHSVRRNHRSQRNRCRNLALGTGATVAVAVAEAVQTESVPPRIAAAVAVDILNHHHHCDLDRAPSLLGSAGTAGSSGLGGCTYGSSM